MSALDRVLGAAGRKPRHATAPYRDEADEAELVLAAAASVREAIALAGASASAPLRASLSAAAGILDSLTAETRLSALPSWVERTSYDPMTLYLADSDGDDDGDSGGYSQGKGEDYADPGYQKDGKKRYPTTEGGKPSEKRVRAAWSYINQEENASAYSPDQVKKIKGKIKSAGKDLGIEFADEDKADSGK